MDQEEYYIHDFIENYADQEDEDIQWKTTCRKEFLDLQGDKKEKPPKPGEFFKHQDMFLRYMIPYDKLFVIHETGTGKTGSIINMTEHYRINEPGRFKKVFILEPGPPTVNDFQEQIVKLSSDDYYNRKIGFRESEDKVFKNNMTRLIKKNYDVTTYQKFVKDNLKISEMNDYYDDSIFFLDEAHKLRNLTDSSGSELTQGEKDQIYDYIWKVLHIAKRTKIVIATATPMINTTRDFVPLLNLLLPMNKQFPMIDDLSFYDNINLGQLEPYLRGKVSYVRFLDTGIKINNKGFVPENYTHILEIPEEKLNKPIKPVSKKIEKEKIVTDEKNQSITNQPKNKTKIFRINSTINIYPVTMIEGGLQLPVYEQIEASKEKDAFSKNRSQSCVFVFPDGSYGSTGFKRFIEKDEFDNYKFKDKVLIKGKSYPSLNAYLDPNNIDSTLENIKQLSCKFYDYIKREIENSTKPRPGNSFCYLELVEGSGVVLLSLILERLGFENFKSNDTTIVNSRTKRIRDSFPKKKRFALITGKTNNLRNILKVFNSPSNLDGEYIQIIIASKLARDGINIENVVRGYIMSAGWHESGMHQALSRFIRATSHENLKNRNLLELENEGKSTKNYRVNVDIYRMAAMKPYEKIEDSETHSVDLKNYLAAEEKDIKIKRIFRYMKRVSYDAYLNYKRNVRETDVSFTKQTDYQDKYIEIWKARGKPNNKERKGLALNQGPNNKDFVYNTYNIFYSSQYEDKIKDLISYIIFIRKLINIDVLINEIMKQYKFLDYYSIYNIIIDLVNSGKEIEDLKRLNFYNIVINGENLYLSEIKYFDSDRISTETDFIFKGTEDVGQIDNREQLLSEIYEAISDMSEEEIKNYYMANQNYIQFKILLEDSIIRTRNKTTIPINNKMMKLFSNYYLKVKIPVGYLEAAKKALTDTSEKKQGRNRAEGSTAGFKNLDLSKIDPKYSKEEIYIHFYRESDKTGFSITSILEGKTRIIRILDSDKFRDSDKVEQFVYTYIFDKFYDKLLEKFKKSKYYGSYIYRGGEQIEDLVKRRREFFRIVDTTNERNKGRVCVNNTATEVQKVLKYVDDKKEHQQYYTGKINKNDICKIIKSLFEKKGLLFESF